MGQVTFLVGVLGEVFPNGGRGFSWNISPRSLTRLAASAAFFFLFLEPVFLCGLSRDILWGFLSLPLQKEPYFMEWTTPRHEEIDLNCEVSSYANAKL
jgi:hypothetical protein